MELLYSKILLQNDNKFTVNLLVFYSIPTTQILLRKMSFKKGFLDGLFLFICFLFITFGESVKIAWIIIIMSFIILKPKFIVERKIKEMFEMRFILVTLTSRERERIV